MSKKPLAVVTMVYNESELLRTWVRHYSGQVGEEACYIVDHGSSDVSTTQCGRANIIRIPRSPQDDERRAQFIGQFCASLLAWYDSVIYTDVDELLVSDPSTFKSLIDFANTSHITSVTATGFDVIHGLGEETPLDYTKLVSLQRRRLRFSSAMCKTVLIRQPVTWAPGFHCCSEAMPDPHPGLFLFHLRYADLDTGLKRLDRTRNQSWASDQAGKHQRVTDVEWSAMVEGMAALPFMDGQLDERDVVLKEYCARVRMSASERIGDLYRVDLHINSDVLWLLPQRFIGHL